MFEDAGTSHRIHNSRYLSNPHLCRWAAIWPEQVVRATGDSGACAIEQPPMQKKAVSGLRFPSLSTAAWLVVCILIVPGCALKEVRSKVAFGPEFRHSGERNTSEVRYYASQGIELKWDRGITTELNYRRREIDEGSGDNENLLLVQVGFPLWEAQQPENPLAKRVRELERRLAELENRQAAENR